MGWTGSAAGVESFGREGGPPQAVSANISNTINERGATRVHFILIRLLKVG